MNINWRCGESNPVPLACEASALPYELHPLDFNQRDWVTKQHSIKDLVSLKVSKL